MTVPVSVRAQRIIDRIVAIDRQHPRIDRREAEAALRQHFERLGLAPLPTRWVSDAEMGYTTVFRAAWSAAESAAWSAAESAAWSAAWSAAESAAWSAAESAAWSAAESAAWSAAWSAARGGDPSIERWIGIWLPFLEASEAGLWLYWVMATEVIAVPRPVLRIEQDRLHNPTGPAVWWPGSAVQYYFWRGIQVPAEVIEHPDTLTGARILKEPNAEIRRAMVEKIGLEAFFDRIGRPAPLHQDETGMLYRIPLDGDPEPLVAVHVTDPSTGRRYFLRVPPTTKTARQAVAWTFSMDTKSFAPVHHS